MARATSIEMIRPIRRRCSVRVAGLDGREREIGIVRHLEQWSAENQILLRAAVRPGPPNVRNPATMENPIRRVTEVMKNPYARRERKAEVAPPTKERNAMMRFIAVVICSLGIAGCQYQTETTLGGVDFSIVGAPHELKVVDDTATVLVGSNKYDLAVQNGNLTINGQDFGSVASGDKVTIHAGVVTINGKPVGPVTEVTK
jgi:hypothetical protein